MAQPSIETNVSNKHRYDLSDDVRRKIVLKNEKYKAHADLKRKFVNFNKGDMLMVKLRLK